MLSHECGQPHCGTAAINPATKRSCTGFKIILIDPPVQSNRLAGYCLLVVIHFLHQYIALYRFSSYYLWSTVIHAINNNIITAVFMERGY